jgi:hypothetical protein
MDQAHGGVVVKRLPAEAGVLNDLADAVPLGRRGPPGRAGQSGHVEILSTAEPRKLSCADFLSTPRRTRRAASPVMLIGIQPLNLLHFVQLDAPELAEST